MAGGMDPTEEYDGTITVLLLDDETGRDEIECSSYERAISLVREHRYEVTVTKIVDRDDEVVFTSADMDIETWEGEWKLAKRRQSVDVEERDCPYDNIACFADDLCVQCGIDKVQEEYYG